MDEFVRLPIVVVLADQGCDILSILLTPLPLQFGTSMIPYIVQRLSFGSIDQNPFLSGSHFSALNIKGFFFSAIWAPILGVLFQVTFGPKTSALSLEFFLESSIYFSYHNRSPKAVPPVSVFLLSDSLIELSSGSSLTFPSSVELSDKY